MNESIQIDLALLPSVNLQNDQSTESKMMKENTNEFLSPHRRSNSPLHSSIHSSINSSLRSPLLKQLQKDLTKIKSPTSNSISSKAYSSPTKIKQIQFQTRQLEQELLMLQQGISIDDDSDVISTSDQHPSLWRHQHELDKWEATRATMRQNEKKLLSKIQKLRVPKKSTTSYPKKLISSADLNISFEKPLSDLRDIIAESRRFSLQIEENLTNATTEETRTECHNVSHNGKKEITRMISMNLSPLRTGLHSPPTKAERARELRAIDAEYSKNNINDLSSFQANVNAAIMANNSLRNSPLRSPRVREPSRSTSTAGSTYVSPFKF